MLSKINKAGKEAYGSEYLPYEDDVTEIRPVTLSWLVQEIILPQMEEGVPREDWAAEYELVEPEYLLGIQGIAHGCTLAGEYLSFDHMDDLALAPEQFLLAAQDDHDDRYIASLYVVTNDLSVEQLRALFK